MIEIGKSNDNDQYIMIVTRKALRMRRINSLKRQISIKEKMLEVGARYPAWLQAQLFVVVVVDGVVVGIVVSVVVVDGAHLTNYCPLEQPSGFC